MTDPDDGVPSLDLTTERDGDTPGAGAIDELGREDDGDVKATDDSEDEAMGDEEVEPVEILVQLAEEGAIEPWDIDIVRVTDAFLSKLDEVDLRTTGRALFYASVLLRMKRRTARRRHGRGA